MNNLKQILLYLWKGLLFQGYFLLYLPYTIGQEGPVLQLMMEKISYSQRRRARISDIYRN